MKYKSQKTIYLLPGVKIPLIFIFKGEQMEPK